MMSGSSDLDLAWRLIEVLNVFEHRSQQLLPPRHFLRRVARFAAISTGIIGVSLAIGSAGYHWVAGLPWIDALLNASMILTGMGPVDRMETAPGKLFSAGYALFSGVAFVSFAAVFMAPFIHRFLHALHLDAEGDAPEAGR